ncbi:MAG: FecCD family ABC transporter permease [Bacteroidota bacterium]
MKNKRIHIILFILGLMLLVLFLAALSLGSYQIDFKTLVHIFSGQDTSDPISSNILINFRLPRVLTAVLAGSALAVAGLQMQTVFQNPLAGPYVLGISAGASLGVALLTMSGISIGAGIFGTTSMVVAAWLGSMGVLMLIFLVSSRVHDVLTILILGILFGSAISAVVSILQYFSTATALKSFIIWSLGSLGNTSMEQLKVLGPVVLVGLVIAFMASKRLNVLLTGDKYALSVGMNVNFLLLVVFLSTGLLAGSITAFCGPIGFIGVAVPHIVKIMMRTSNHFYLIPGTILAGADIMLFSDILSKLPGQQQTLPINSVTAVVGIPVIIWIILKNKKLSHS